MDFRNPLTYHRMSLWSPYDSLIGFKKSMFKLVSKKVCVIFCAFGLKKHCSCIKVVGQQAIFHGRIRSGGVQVETLIGSLFTFKEV